MSGIEVTTAQDSEAAACLALTPEMADTVVELLVARRHGRFAGAAAISWQSWTTPGGFPLLLHVIPAERRQGVGRALFNAAIAITNEETDGLLSYPPVEDDTDAARFMAACGFRPRRRHIFFEADIEALLADVGPKADRLRARGYVAGTRIGPLSVAPLDQISAMVASALGHGPGSAVHGLTRRASQAGQIAGDRSQVAMRDGLSIGVILWRIVQGVAIVDARVVQPGFRGGWPNAMLLEAGLRRGQTEGVKRFRFHCDDTVSDTLRLAKRCAAVETAIKSSWYYAMAAD